MFFWPKTHFRGNSCIVCVQSLRDWGKRLCESVFPCVIFLTIWSDDLDKCNMIWWWSGGWQPIWAKFASRPAQGRGASYRKPGESLRLPQSNTWRTGRELTASLFMTVGSLLTFSRPPTGQQGKTPTREVALVLDGQNQITLEYQICPPAIDTPVTEMRWVAAFFLHEASQ